MLAGIFRRRVAAHPTSLRISTGRTIATSQKEKGRSYSYSIEEWWVLIPAGLFASAAWNFFRARAKEKVCNSREIRLKMEELNGNEIHTLCSTESLDSLEFIKVVCKGVYDENNSILVKKYLKMKSGGWVKGYDLITPLNPIPGDPESIQSPILVNRGWVPLSWGNKASEVESNSSSSPPVPTHGREEHLPPPSPVQFIGVISKGERPNKLWRWNDPAKSEWFTVDVAALASACDLPQTTLHVVEIDFSSKMNVRKPATFPSLRREVNGIYLSQLEHMRYASLGFFNGCAAMAMGLKKFGKH